LKKIAFLFPGQGSQVVGMGLDFYQKYDFAREVFDMAEEITRLKIGDLCFAGPMVDLTQTIHLQPAITAVNLTCLAALQREGVAPLYSAGHSLGEYSALVAAGVISAADSLRLVFRRGELMQREATRFEGAMAAIIGLAFGQVEQIVAAVTGIVSIANHNSSQQIVITGQPEAVRKASSLAKEKGGKAIPLKVSGAWHSALIKGAEEEFRQFLSGIPFSEPQTPIIHNVTADVCSEPDAIRDLMVRQLCSPVLWHDSVCRLMDQGVDTFVELGPGKVLSGLVKKILPPDFEGKVCNIGDLASLEAFLPTLF
jgi:[acyl-carrier-protein] S-malonyltransferase